MSEPRPTLPGKHGPYAPRLTRFARWAAQKNREYEAARVAWKADRPDGPVEVTEKVR